MASKPKKAKVVGQVTEDEYLVEKILDKKHEDGIWKYFIKWNGWPSDTNTWEPLAHLKGCEQMLAAFEKKWALENPELAGTIKPDSHNEEKEEENESDYDSDENVGDGLDKTKQYMDFDVMEECPPNKEPNRVVGVIDLNGTLTYLVEWKKDQENMTEEDEPDRSLIRSTVFQLKYPSIVIRFYEKHISFAKNPTSNEVVSAVAAHAMTETRDRNMEENDEEDNLDVSDPNAVAPTQSELGFNDLDSSSDSTGEEDEYEVDGDA